MSLLQKIRYAIAHPEYLVRRLTDPVYSLTNYDQRQWARIVMHDTLFERIQALGPETLSALEISPGGPDSPWKALAFQRYRGVDYPFFDICKETLDEEFDIIIADQVFEHLLWPYRAAKNVYKMLKPDGIFVNTTPFLIRIHANPVDCSRWTELGMKHLLAEAGFELDKIHTGSWGNAACVRANLVAPSWARVGWGRSMENQEEFPVAIWALARK